MENGEWRTENEVTALINEELSLSLAKDSSYEELILLLSGHINELINKDFEKLLTFLYRIDVDEKKLKSLLLQYKEEDAGRIIAELIIERQQQKIESRKQFKTDPGEIEEDEKW
jgi:hypothetical protein